MCLSFLKPCDCWAYQNAKPTDHSVDHLPSCSKSDAYPVRKRHINEYEHIRKTWSVNHNTAPPSFRNYLQSQHGVLVHELRTIQLKSSMVHAKLARQNRVPNSAANSKEANKAEKEVVKLAKAEVKTRDQIDIIQMLMRSEVDAPRRKR